MSRQFSEVRDILLRRTEGPTNWQFLSLSFDPDFDRPEVLAHHARLNRGDNPDRWLFAALSTNSLAEISPKLDLHVTQVGGTIAHNLRTVVVDTRHRLFRSFEGNQWSAGELADALVEAARQH